MSPGPASPMTYDRDYSAKIYRTEEALVGSMVMVNSGRWLDVGCGTGSIFNHWSVRRRVAPASYLGVDCNPEMVKVARGKGLEVEVGDASALPFKDGSFDLVTALWSVATHGDVEAHLSEMSRVLAPHGQACVVCYGERRRYNRENAQWSTEAWRPRYWRPDELSAALQRAGFHDVDVRGLRILPVHLQDGVRGSVSRALLRVEWWLLSRVMVHRAVYLVGTGWRSHGRQKAYRAGRI